MAGYLSSAELVSITATVQQALDVSLPLSRVTSTTPDGSGTETETVTPQGNILCNIINPTATTLQTYGSKIGSQRALTLRVMQTTDIRENDLITYDSLTWRVQALMDAESYTVTKEYLISVIGPA